jgi:alpha-galactosidase
MKSITRAFALLAILTGSLGAQTAGPAKSPPPNQAGKGPIKIFLLAGQSNMEGQGIIGGTQKGTLETLSKDPASAERYKHLLDKDGKWKVREDVWCAYGEKGALTAGGFAAAGCIGPELGFGWMTGDYLDNQVLLIKIAAGGTSLAQNWRPPSSGGELGGLYQAVLDTVKKLPETLKADFPNYDGKGYEIAGFGWHQGWQDGCAQPMADEYEKNMVNFIKDLRKDLGLPNLPFVIGGSGFGGWDQKVTRRLQISAAQKAAAERPEFKGNVLYVETRGFFRPRELSPHGFGYHWNGNAETYYLIGEGMGKAMLELLGGPKAPPIPVNPNPQRVRPKEAGDSPKEIAVLKLEELTIDLGNQVTMRMVKIPAGKFLMGSPESEDVRQADEVQHEVTISQPFFMAVTEVTVAQFDQFVKDSGYAWEKPVYAFPQRADHPATATTWNDAQAFCKWLSGKCGKTVSLPSEAQWEYACRAGTTTRYASGDYTEDLLDYGHYASNGWDAAATNSPMFAPVASFKPNAFGLYDMHGNLMEWCQDFYAPYPAGPQTDPTGPATGGKNVARGGNWHNSAEKCRSAIRYQAAAARAFNRDGFRVTAR